jgi:hypothetical protein
MMQLTAVGVFLLTLLAVSVFTQDRPDLSANFDEILAQKTAARFLEVCRKNDSAQMNAIAMAEQPDPFLVAHALYVGGLLEGGKAGPDLRERLEAARRLASLAPVRQGLLPLVQKWGGGDPGKPETRP